MDNHMDKTWALAVTKDGSEMISGGTDSTIDFWRDFTEEEEAGLQLEKETKLLKEQQLFNRLYSDKLLEAMQIAFELGHPNRLLQTLHDLLESPRHKDQPVLPDDAPINPDTFETEVIFAQVVKSLDDEQLKTLLDWVLISSLLRELPPTKLKKLENMGKTLEALIAYSERHFQPIDRMLQKSYLVDFSIVSMKKLFPAEELFEAAAAADAKTSDESDGSDSETETEVVEEEKASASKRRKL